MNVTITWQHVALFLMGWVLMKLFRAAWRGRLTHRIVAAMLVFFGLLTILAPMFLIEHLYGFLDRRKIGLFALVQRLRGQR